MAAFRLHALQNDLGHSFPFLALSLHGPSLDLYQGLLLPGRVLDAGVLPAACCIACQAGQCMTMLLRHGRAPAMPD